MKRTVKTLPAILLAVTLLLSCVKEKGSVRIQPGETIPEFFTFTLDGQNISPEWFEGRPSLIAFFSTTCPDCHEQLPKIQRVFESLDTGAAILCIAREENDKTVSAFWKETGFTMPVAAPGSRDIYNLFDRNSKSGVPLLIFSNESMTVIQTSDDKHILSDLEIYNILINNNPNS